MPAEAQLYRERLDFIKHLALEAGKLTLEGWGKCGQMPKGGQDGYDIATEYDFRTEELVRRRIEQVSAEPILGEEGGLTGDRAAARDGLWIVDPIDGTFNYQRGLPLYGVSIAFCEKGVPVCGAVYLPVVDQLFGAAQGSGAFLVERDLASPVPISVSREREWGRLVISLAGQNVYRLVAACAAEGFPWRSLRFYLCAVASLAFIAAGRLDIFSDMGLNLWDCAAGDILLREAGGPGTFDYEGRPIFPVYVNRHLDRDGAGGFAMVAASHLELYEEPMKRFIASAGLSGEGKRLNATPDA
jgi:myo-inositol-1(or 4)-monophosphatase